MPPTERRPPLAVSPRRLRPRKNLRSVPSLQSPPGSIKSKPKTPIRSSLPCEPEYHLISTELAKMARRVSQEFSQFDKFGSSTGLKNVATTSPLFERGRFYEAYSARRNERLRRKQLEYYYEVEEATIAQDPGIAVELAKRRASKKAESGRKSVPANFSVSRVSSLRSSVSNSREIKKASAASSSSSSLFANREKTGDVGAAAGRRIETRSVRRI